MAGLRARWLNLSLARKGMILAAIPVAAIVLASLPIIANDVVRMRANDAIESTHEAREKAQSVMLNMRDAENRVLAFMLTGDSTQLARFSQSVRQASAALAESEALTADTTMHEVYLEVRTRLRQMEADLAHEATLSTQRKTSVEFLQAMLGQEARSTSALRRAVDSLIVSETAILERRVAALDSSRRIRVYLAVLVLLLSAIGAGASAMLYTSGVAARIEQLQESATAAPSLTRVPQTVKGTDELGQLAAAIEANLQQTARMSDRLSLAIRAAHIEVLELRPIEDTLAVVGSGDLFRRIGDPANGIPKTFSGLIEQIHPEDRDRVSHTLRTLKAGADYAVDFRMSANAADWRWMELRGAAAAEKGALAIHTGAVGVLLDVTERKAAEEQVRLAMISADEANRAKSEFLSRMSHELRTPLNAVLGFAQLLELGSLSADQRDSVSHILRGGRYLVNLINEVLDLARIEAGRLGLVIEPVPVREVIGAVVTLIGPQATEFGVRLVISPATSHDFVRADRQRLQQVLLNLFSNAIKYNHRGGTAELLVTRSAGSVLLSVKDTGPGMSPEHVERLFQPFERLDAARSGVEGTGLGLALSRTIVEAMGGRITVESHPGAGSTFTVELDEASPQDDFLSLPPFAETKHDQVTVVYVEDNDANVRLVERIVARRPRIRLVTIGEGDRALELIRAERPALVLLDVNLPGLPGDEILKRIRLDRSMDAVPVAILSADATPSQIVALCALGAQYYLTKPVDIGMLMKVLDAAVTEAEAATQVSDAHDSVHE